MTTQTPAGVRAPVAAPAGLPPHVREALAFGETHALRTRT